MTDVLCTDARFSGCVSFAAISAGSPLVFCADANRKLVSVFTSSPGVLKWANDGAVQAARPQFVFSDGVYIHVLAPGLWYRVDSSNTVQASASPYGLTNPTWGFAASPSIVVVPYGSTGVQTLDAATGASRYILPDVASRVAVAAGGNGFVYCLDQDRASLTVLSVDANGVLAVVSSPRIAVPNGHIIRAALVDGSALVVVTDHRVITYSLNNPSAPSYTGVTKFSQTLRGIWPLGSGRYWFATDETIPAQKQAFALPTVSVLTANGVLVSFSPYEGYAESTTTPFDSGGNAVIL